MTMRGPFDLETAALPEREAALVHDARAQRSGRPGAVGMRP